MKNNFFFSKNVYFCTQVNQFKNKKNMKKLIGLFLVAGMVTFFACGPKGPSEADKKKADSLKQDSIAKVEKAKADSLAAVEKAKAKADSLKQDSIAKAEKKGGNKGGVVTGGNKPKPTTPVEKPKPVSRRG